MPGAETITETSTERVGAVLETAGSVCFSDVPLLANHDLQHVSLNLPVGVTLFVFAFIRHTLPRQLYANIL
jgi:hypothetical protein